MIIEVQAREDFGSEDIYSGIPDIDVPLVVYRSLGTRLDLMQTTTNKSPQGTYVFHLPYIDDGSDLIGTIDYINAIEGLFAKHIPPSSPTTDSLLTPKARPLGNCFRGHNK